VIEDYGNVAFIDGITFAEAPAGGVTAHWRASARRSSGKKQC
jgi:hypothetical protein